MSGRKWIVLGSVLSTVLLGVILWRLDWSVFSAELRHLSFAWLAAACALEVASIALRSLRWNVAAGAPLTAWGSFTRATAAGLLFNQIYPLRAGEILRLFLIGRLAQVSLGRAAASALADRLADMLLLGATALLVATAHSGLQHARELAAGAFLTSLAVVFSLLAFTRGNRLWRHLITRWTGRVSPPAQERVEGFYTEALATSALLGSPLRVACLLALTAAAFATDCAVVYCVIEAFGWALPLMAAATVLVFLAVGTSLPSAPGYAGVFQAACVFALALFGVAESQAVAYAIVLQLSALAPTLALSAWTLARHAEQLKSLRRTSVGIG
jgi:uncharacterized protein (TIRG00374 family)